MKKDDELKKQNVIKIIVEILEKESLERVVDVLVFIENYLSQ